MRESPEDDNEEIELTPEFVAEFFAELQRQLDQEFPARGSSPPGPSGD